MNSHIPWRITTKRKYIMTDMTYGKRTVSAKTLERANKLRELLSTHNLVTREMMREAFGRKFFWSALAVVKSVDGNVVAVRDGRKILGWTLSDSNTGYQVLETVDFSEARNRVAAPMDAST